MTRGGVALAVFLASAAACVGQAFLYAAALPARVASHFGPDGVPNAWMSRDRLVALDLCVVGLLTIVFLGIALLFRSVGTASINLPNRDYWLAPERRAETVDSLSRSCLWFGAGTLLLMLDVFRQVFRFNLSASGALEHPRASLAAYLAFAAAWIAAFFRRFARTPPAP